MEIEKFNFIKETGICAIVRGTPASSICKVAEALLVGGVKAIEITFNTPGADEMIKELSNKYSKDMIIGAGTVLDPETARTAILSGASFILSPSLNVKVIRMCQRYSVAAVPGVCTPTEIITAWENGANVVKIFPSGALGARYIKEVRGPLSQVDMMAVGGINVDNIGEFIRAGVCSAGIGSELVDKTLVQNENFEEITIRAKRFVEAVKIARS